MSSSEWRVEYEGANGPGSVPGSWEWKPVQRDFTSYREFRDFLAFLKTPAMAVRNVKAYGRTVDPWTHLYDVDTEAPD